MWNVRQKPERGSKFNLGAQVLRRVLEHLKWSQTRLKNEIETEQAISYWLFGDRCPGLESAVALRNRLAIPVDFWLAPPVEDAAELGRIVAGVLANAPTTEAAA